MRTLCAGWLVLGLAACGGEVIPSRPGNTDKSASEEAFVANVKPILDGFCAGCHAAQANIDFMKPDPDVRTAVLSWNGLVNLDAPTSSKLLTKGPHEGPAFTPDQAATILDWIELEVEESGGVVAPAVETDPITPVAGINTIDLSPLGLTDATLSFLYEPLATGMYLSDIQVSGGTTGAHLVNPLFVMWTDDVPEPDPINRFGNVEVDLAPASSAMVGGGTAVFVDISPKADVSVHFRTAEPSDGGAGGGIIGGGCNNVPAFTAQARSALANACASCHGPAGQLDARNAIDMSRINDLTTEGQAAACGQVKTRVNPADPPASGLFLAPDPASGTQHPFKFATPTQFTDFRGQVVQWISQE